MERLPFERPRPFLRKRVPGYLPAFCRPPSPRICHLAVLLMPLRRPRWRCTACIPALCHGGGGVGGGGLPAQGSRGSHSAPGSDPRVGPNTGSAHLAEAPVAVREGARRLPPADCGDPALGQPSVRRSSLPRANLSHLSKTGPIKCHNFFGIFENSVQQHFCPVLGK